MTRQYAPARRALLVALLLLSAWTPLVAQGTATVPLDDPAYRYLDRLEELGLADSAVMGQRPYSEREMRRLVRGARAAMELHERSATESPVVRSLIAALAARFDADGPAPPRLRPVNEIESSLTVTNSRRRAFPSNSNENVEATIDPLALRRLGEPIPRGGAFYLEVDHRADPLPWLTVAARERLSARAPRDSGASREHAELLVAAARARWRNVAISAGRDQVAWGHGHDDGLFIAADAPALDRLSLSSDQPFALPGVLRHTGPTQATLIVADLGASVVRSHSRLVAYKVSVRPTPALELGGTFENHFGGAGNPPTTALARLFDLMPFIDIFRRHNYTDSSRTLDPESDKVIGADVRWRVDALRGLILSGEWLLDDFDVHRVRSLLTTAASHSFAATVPRLGRPDLSLTLSARHMGIETYSHGALTNGMTSRGRLLGDELGPDAKAFGAELRWMPSAALAATLEGRTALYSHARYFICPPPGACTEYILTVVSRSPDELRDRAIATLTLSRSDGVELFLRGGAERVRNPVSAATPRHGYVADVAVRWRP